MKVILIRIRNGILYYAKMFVKWIAIALLVGAISGFVGFAFYFMVRLCTDTRIKHEWLIFLMPAGAAGIALLYKITNSEGLGTNEVIDSIHFGDKIPTRLIPVIFISTVITHLFGGSAGREGAALQIGGGIGCQTGKLLKLDEKDMRLITLCGMSALFSALFGLPVTATIFALEVISVGVLYYSGFVPCIIGSATSLGITGLLGAKRETFVIESMGIDVMTTVRIVILGILCALVSIVFCEAMHHVEKRFRLSVKNKIIRGLIGGVILIGMTLIFGTAYNGTGESVIAAAIAGEHVFGFSFFIKILFTAVSLGCGFKGGEIVPSFFIGACFGNAFGALIGLPPGAAAALGLVAMFCGAFNCPLAAIMLSIEMFGAGNLLYFAIVCGISYMLSGYFGIYRSQKIVYSKLKAEFINRYTR